MLSKKALQKFGKRLQLHKRVCFMQGRAEDVEMGRCLAHSAIFVDGRDDKLQKRFFPAGVGEHFSPHIDWYINNQYYRAQDGNLNCCSETSIMFHYIHPPEMYKLEYLLYRVNQVFGSTQLDDKLLPKLKLKEIIDASDIESSSPNFRRHRIYHAIESSEIYKRK